jgi:hypothetical protein
MIYEDRAGEIYFREVKEFLSKFENLKLGEVDGIAWDNMVLIAQLKNLNADNKQVT